MRWIRFKGSLCFHRRQARPWQRAYAAQMATIECVVCPVADGGEGTSAALTEGLHGETVRVRVTGPLGEKVTAEYGVKGDPRHIGNGTGSGPAARTPR